MKILCTVERYRAGEIGAEDTGYDLSNELDRAIWCAMQLYVDYAERRELAGELPRFRQAWEFERAILDLKAVANGADMEAGELYETAQSVAEAMFAPENAGSYYIPREFWESGREDVAADASEREAPAQITETLAPLAHLILLGLGEMVSQRKAAEILGLTNEGVRGRVARGQLRMIRVGGSVLIPTADLG